MFVLDVCGDWLSDDLALVAEEADEDEALDPGLKTLTHAKLNLNQVAEKEIESLVKSAFRCQQSCGRSERTEKRARPKGRGRLSRCSTSFIQTHVHDIMSVETY